jgi:hypothetical protein
MKRVLLWNDGKFHFANAIEFKDSSGMILILPFTLMATTFISFIVIRYEKLTQNSR